MGIYQGDSIYNNGGGGGGGGGGGEWDDITNEVDWAAANQFNFLDRRLLYNSSVNLVYFYVKAAGIILNPSYAKKVFSLPVSLNFIGHIYIVGAPCMATVSGQSPEFRPYYFTRGDMPTVALSNCWSYNSPYQSSQTLYEKRQLDVFSLLDDSKYSTTGFEGFCASGMIPVKQV